MQPPPPASVPASAAIVQLADAPDTPSSVGVAAEEAHELLARARAFAAPLLSGEVFDTGEAALAHADGVAGLLLGLGAAPGVAAAAYLVYAGEYLARPEEVVAKTFGPGYAGLVSHTRKLVQLQRSARDALADARESSSAAHRAAQIERVRKMLLAFSRDLRVVLLRLASRLQTLRHYAASKQPCPRALAEETAQVFAPLANRLGLWQLKWELEDLSFRFLQPEAYQRIARLLDAKRGEREAGVETVRARLAEALAASGVQAEVQGRPKHLYSIWKKMQGKRLPIDRIFDLQALRVIVPTVRDCYAALSRVHELWQPLPEEFDDYIARPKPNGYRSLHTVVLDPADGLRPIEVQIRTREMHEQAESGLAAHWAYKEAGTRGYAGVQADDTLQAPLAQARKAVLHQLLAWERELAAPAPDASGAEAATVPDRWFDERIFVFTPQAEIVELPAGATAIDLAYTLHTELGHRCRGAKVDGAMVPLVTPLQSGQTVEIIATKEGGPSLDWLNPELGYLASPRARAKVRAWFNAIAQAQTIARGRETVEKLLQREGRTTIKLDELAAQLGFRDAQALFEGVGKDEFPLRPIELALRPSEPAPDADELLAQRLARGASEAAVEGGGVLVVGVASLMTTLARCCKPAPPDRIGGYVTRGKGVAVHRESCSNFRQMKQRAPERVIPVTWGKPGSGAEAAVYPVDVFVQAHDRPGLLRDITEVFAKEKTNVIGASTHSNKGIAAMTFTVEVGDAARLDSTLLQVRQIAGVTVARRV